MNAVMDENNNKLMNRDLFTPEKPVKQSVPQIGGSIFY